MMKDNVFRSSLTNGLLSLCGLCVLVSTISCSSNEDPLLDFLDTQLSSVKIDNLSRTMNFVVSPERFKKVQFEEKLAASLNRWGESEADLMSPDDWSFDAMAEKLLESSEDVAAITNQKDLGFSNTDSYFLQQNFWAKKLAERLVANRDLGPFEVIRVTSNVDEAMVDKDDDPLRIALQKLHDGLSDEASLELANTLKLFDWSVRNIMLLPNNSIIGDEGDPEDFRLNDASEPSAAGIPGLGYTRFPGQTMLLSRGDYVERAKVFMTMLNQLGIESVMLAYMDDEGNSVPWAVGVNCGQRLYIFDTKLGLPIPGKTFGQIATLSELKSDPELLNSLDLSVNESLKDQTKYWVKEDQLKQLKGLIFCPPETLTYRSWELENRLVGDARMKLYMEPSKIAAGMPKVDGLEYEIWDIDFKTHQFRRALRDAIAEASFKDATRDKIGWYYSDEFYVNEFVRYRTARSKYFHGLFETIRNDGNLNAIELFYNMIYKDAKIDSLASDTMFQRSLGIDQGTMSSSEFSRMISGIQTNMRLVRRDAGYFLSQCHFDNGNFSTAANWLTRLETIEDTARWQQAINYLRARSLESQRDYQSAIKIYDKQDAEHYHGDLIRVRQLKELLGDSYVSADVNTDSEEKSEESDAEDENSQADEKSNTKEDVRAEEK